MKGKRREMMRYEVGSEENKMRMMRQRWTNSEGKKRGRRSCSNVYCLCSIKDRIIKYND